MTPLRKNSNGLTGPLTTGTINPKVVAATVLMIVMAGLWLRVFLRNRSGPAKANARTLQAASTDPASPPESRPIHIRPRSLPVVPGRHDRLAGDPFVLDRTQWFAGSPTRTTPAEQPTQQTEDRKHQANLRRIARRLVLEAVIKDADGVPIKACVNGTVLFKGSTIQVKENGEIYELRVDQISPTEIKLVWQVFELNIQMPSSEWLDSSKGGVL